MPQKVTYALKTARHLQETTKQILADLPDAASEFILAIQQDTQPLTRYAYARDLSLFFRYLGTRKSRVRRASDDLVECF